MIKTHLLVVALMAWPGRAELPADVKDAPASPPASARIAPEGEPGSPLVVGGTVYAPDGITTLAGVTVYAYQVDAKGRYREDGGLEPPRLRGWATTDARGHYEFRTIRPVPYPNHEIPAHLHFHLWGKGYPRQFTDDLQFSDDPFVTPGMLGRSAARGRFANICQPRKDPDGAERCNLDIRLLEKTNYPG